MSEYISNHYISSQLYRCHSSENRRCIFQVINVHNLYYIILANSGIKVHQLED